MKEIADGCPNSPPQHKRSHTTKEITNFAEALAYYQGCEPVDIDGFSSWQNEWGIVREFATDGQQPVDAEWSPSAQRYIAVHIGTRTYTA